MVKGIILSVTASIIIITGCGGGGGGVGNIPTNVSYISHEEEYQAQYGLNKINTANANLGGSTGENIRIAVIDTGIDANHQEFNQGTILGSDFSGSSGGHAADVQGHGTHVAAIISAEKDNFGMRGVAYTAQLYSYRTATNGGDLFALNSDAGRAAVYQQHVTDNIQVSNNSWGSTSNILNYNEADLRVTDSLSIAAMRSAQENGTIFVFAANNSYQDEVSKEAGLPYYINELADQFLTVMAVDNNLKEAAFSNRCGIAADFCLAAPGKSIYSAKTGGGYTNKSGTSMAAPHVSGVLALVINQFPSLSATDVVNRVKATASLDNLTSYSGCTLESCSENEMRAVFGHGLVNAQAAVNPVGVLHYPMPGSKKKTKKPVLNVPQGLGQDFRKWVANLNVAMFDDFDNARFMRKGSDVFSSKAQSTAALIAYSPNQSKTLLKSNQSSEFSTEFGHYSQSYAMGSNAYPVYFSSSLRAMNLASANFWGDLSGLLIQPGFIPKQLHEQIEMPLYQGKFLSLRPFMQIIKKTQTSLAGFGFNLLWQYKDTQLLSSLSHSKQNLSLGVNKAYDRSQQQIQSIEIGLQQRFTESTMFFLRSAYSQLNTDPANTQQWGLKQANLMRLSSGLEIKNKNFKFVFGLYDPGHFTEGEVSLFVAKGINKNKQVYYEEERFELKTEQRLAGFFAAKGHFMLGGKQAVDISLSIQQSPYKRRHVDQASLSAAFDF